MRLFISYSRNDFNFARALHEALLSAGARPWLDRLNIAHGADWAAEIRRGIQACDAFVLVASPWSLKSAQVKREWDQAVARGVPCLVLLLQSLDPTLEPFLTHADVWLDARTAPFAAIEQVCAWANQHEVSMQSGTLPAESARLPLLHAALPAEARRVGLLVLVFGLLGIAINGALLVSMAALELGGSVNNICGFEREGDRVSCRLMISIAMMLPLLAITMFASDGLNAARLIGRREHPKPVGALGNLQYVLVMLGIVGDMAALSIVLSAMPMGMTLEDFAEAVINPHWYLDDPTIVHAFILYGSISLAAGAVLVLLTQWFKRAAVLRCWQPMYWGRVMRGGSWKTAAAPQPTLPTAQQKRVLPQSPVKQTCLVFAPEDAPFARWLRAQLWRQGIQCLEHLPVLVADDQFAAVGLIIVSPWLLRDAETSTRWQALLASGMPALLVSVQDTADLPDALGHLNWIDASKNLNRAKQDILDTLSGKPQPQRTYETLDVPGRRTRGGFPTPRAISLLVAMTMISSVVKMLIAMFISPLALWTQYYSVVLPEHLLLLVLLGAAAFAQMLLAGAYNLRQVSGRVFVTGIVGCGVVSMLCLALVWPDLQLIFSVTDIPFGSFDTPTMVLVVGLLDILIILLLIAAPDCRGWTLGGRHLQLHDLPPASSSQYALITLGGTLIVLLPVFSRWINGG